MGEDQGGSCETGEPDFDDPEGIAVPWEEKYGNSAKSDTWSQECDETDEDSLTFDDPDGIAVPWEEKYGVKPAKKGV